MKGNKQYASKYMKQYIHNNNSILNTNMIFTCSELNGECRNGFKWNYI